MQAKFALDDAHIEDLESNDNLLEMHICHIKSDCNVVLRASAVSMQRFARSSSRPPY